MTDTKPVSSSQNENDTLLLVQTTSDREPPALHDEIVAEPIDLVENDKKIIPLTNKRRVTFTGFDKASVLPFTWALGTTAAATLAAYLLLQITTATLPALLYIVAVTISTWRGGLKVGLATAFVSALSLSYFFLPYTSISASLVSVGQFLLASVLVSFIIDTSTNATKIAALSQRLMEQNQSLTAVTQSLTNAQQEIKARDEFLSIVSHELKTPLTSMLLQLQIALHNIRNVSLANFSVENLMKMLQSAEDQTVRLSKMINDLLNVSLITTGRLDLNRQAIDLSDVVKGVFENFSEGFVAKGYQVNLALDEHVVGIWDKIRIEQAVTNLISNAIKYGDSKPITIMVQKRGNTGIVVVQDQGIGIQKDIQKRIFDRFERGVSASEFKGLGVGLYITNQIVQAHGGTIAVKSTPGNGSTFTAQLPLNDA